MNRALDVVHFLALLLAAVCLGPALAHLFELPAKMQLDRDGYFTVQQIYRGWALFGVAIVGALVSSVALAVLLRSHRRARRWAAAAALGIVAAQAVFWIFTYPANVATENWTTMPEDWRILRARWEYSHAAGALLMLGAMAALVLSLLARVRDAPPKA
jgi:hypothetical protein